MALSQKIGLKRKTLLYAISIAITLIFLHPIFTSIEYSLLQIERLFSAPGEKFVVGDAIISKPRNWLLSTSRKHANSTVVFFGVFPEWLAFNNVAAPIGPYYSFLVLDEYKVMAQIDFLETPADLNEQLILLLQNMKSNPLGHQNGPQRKLIKIKQWDALLTEPIKKNGPEFIYIPELKLTVRTANFTLLENISIQRIGA